MKVAHIKQLIQQAVLINMKDGVKQLQNSTTYKHLMKKTYQTVISKS